MYAYLTGVTITPVEEGMPPAVTIPAAFYCVYIARRYGVGGRSKGLLYGGILPAEGGFVQDKVKELRGTMHSFIDTVVWFADITKERTQILLW